ncbi:TlpA disulfide reductase family protein [Paenibacillus validus]|uniref:TlpA family protein disulfide reductase n=1 Tax=Paenibacillus TaxID=44249 RepID=UPI000FD9B65F|nr:MULTISPECIES: TlpA disulfide reductase family protein [Paenibacillus]MED4602790.1 TlpA disulfide reductase family protein [Paenibacillus validus]MED4608378.1 TlpA disulfide reductase family protein [Paenibacillus validus]
MKKTIALAVAALVLAVTAGWQWQRMDRQTKVAAAAAAKPSVAVDLPVPHHVIKGLDGKEYVIGGTRDKPLLINFWASWCGPCHEEVPALKHVYKRYKDHFDLYAVNVTKGDSIKDVNAFVQGHDLPFPVLLDTSGEAANDFRILFVPTSFLVDKHGRLVEIVHVLAPDELEAKIKKLIDASPAS